MAAPLATPNTERRTPIAAMRRPRSSMCQGHTFGSASLPDGAAAGPFSARGHKENR
jgi:hypothetical protein